MGTAVDELRALLRMLRLPPRRVAVAVGWGVLALGSGLALAALAAWLIARAWQMPPVLDLTIAVVAVRALGISRGVCRYLERLATHDVALWAMSSTRTETYRALARSDRWLPQRGPRASAEVDQRNLAGMRQGDLLVRLGRDIDDLGAVVVRSLIPIVVAMVLAVAAVGLLATISWRAAAILAGALVLSGVVAPWMSARAAATATEARQGDRAEFTAQAVNLLDHAAELRVAGRLTSGLAAAEEQNRRATAAEDATAARSALSAAATPFALGVTVLGALLIGITTYDPAGDAMSPMSLAVLVLLPLSAFEAVGPLPTAAQTLTTARVAARRLHAATSASETSTTPVALATAPVTRVQAAQLIVDHAGITRPVAGAVLGSVNSNQWMIPALLGTSGLSQEGQSPPGVRASQARGGQRIAVVGPSGAGKTTLLMAWAGLFDTPIPGVTFFAEDAHLFRTSVLENLRVARGDLTMAEAEQALRAVGAGQWLASLPEGIHTELVGGSAAVSGGQRRRILLARALISPAQVLLLDEPTEHIAAEPGTQLLNALLDAESGLVRPERTVVVATHQLPERHQADLVLHINASGLVSVDFSRNGAAEKNPLHPMAPAR